MAQLKRPKTIRSLFDDEENDAASFLKEEPVRRKKALVVTSSPLPRSESELVEQLSTGDDVHDIGLKKKLRLFLNKKKEIKFELRKLEEDGRSTDVNFIVLSIDQVRKLLDGTEAIDDAMLDVITEGACQFTPLNLGMDTHVTVLDRFPCVDIRKFFSPRQEQTSPVTPSSLRPTRLGVCLTRSEWGTLRNLLEERLTMVKPLNFYQDTTVAY